MPATISSLPQEFYNRIVDILNTRHRRQAAANNAFLSLFTDVNDAGPSLSLESQPRKWLIDLSTASRKFQHAAERLTFKDISLSISRLDEFEAIVTRYEHRCGMLRSVTLDPKFPVPERTFECHDTDEETYEKNIMVSNAVGMLWRGLKAAEMTVEKMLVLESMDVTEVTESNVEHGTGGGKDEEMKDSVMDETGDIVMEEERAGRGEPVQASLSPQEGSQRETSPQLKPKSEPGQRPSEPGPQEQPKPEPQQLEPALRLKPSLPDSEAVAETESKLSPQQDLGTISELQPSPDSGEAKPHPVSSPPSQSQAAQPSALHPKPRSPPHLRPVPSSTLPPRSHPTPAPPTAITVTILPPEQAENPLNCLHKSFSSWPLRLVHPENLPTLRHIRVLNLHLNTEFAMMFHPSVVLDLLSRTGSAGKDADEEATGFLEELSIELPDRAPFTFTNPLLTRLTHMFQGPRRDSRHEFGNALLHRSQKQQKQHHDLRHDQHPGRSITRLRFSSSKIESDPEPNNHSRPMPNLILPSPFDPFSAGLRVWLSGLPHLRKLVIDSATLDASFFWPSVSEAEAERTSPSPSQPCKSHSWYQSLEEHHTHLTPILTSGHWLFTTPATPYSQHSYTNPPFDPPAGLYNPGKSTSSPLTGLILGVSDYPPREMRRTDHSDHDLIAQAGDGIEWVSGNKTFRHIPVDKELLPLVKAWARGLAQIKNLRRASLWFRVYPRADGPGEVWGVAYRSPEEAGGVGEWRWNVGDWKPDEETLDLCNSVGHARGTTASNDYEFLDEQNADGIFSGLTTVAEMEKFVAWP
ncbi:hypothetical protein MKZ38_007724 [Zalerion maritima]|uniref:Uncharacterized protein n=1 Tax=Zalerion maritima TaxID=339359 RepID=A0AAD5RHU9_9PEZI|nr:hypothetical protein MKZ38_007724 [Zalerion maritima]